MDKLRLLLTNSLKRYYTHECYFFSTLFKLNEPFQKVDLLGFPFTMNYDRAAKMDFSTYYIFTQYALMVPYPEEQSRIDALIRPFETKVYILYPYQLLAKLMLKIFDM